MSTLTNSSLFSIAQSLGFDACGVSLADELADDSIRLKDWLQKGMHGEMEYMARNIEKRCDPTLLVPGAKSVISVLLSYFPGNPQLSVNPPKVSRYALSVDYHQVMKNKLWLMLERLRELSGEVSGRAFVDSAPVLERSWAVKCGLGWIGKNGLLINPMFGSYVFIGELIVDKSIELTTTKEPNRCGNCKRCMESCPTGAIIAPGVIDSRRCISYLTIEKKSPLTDIEYGSLSGWCFGCDVCQEVCPWNSKINISELPELKPKAEILNLDKDGLINLRSKDFEYHFGNTPVSRSGYSRFIENARIAANE